MFNNLPKSGVDAFDWNWDQFTPYFKDLNERDLDQSNLDHWMGDWSKVSKLINEINSRLYAATTQDTSNKIVEKQYFDFLENIFPNAVAAEQELKSKLLDSNLVPSNFDVQIRNMRAEAALFHKKNIKLLSKELMLNNKYDKFSGDQSVMWEGKEVTLQQLQPVYQDEDRGKREKAWTLSMNRWQEDRSNFNDLWVEFLDLREKLAENAGLPSYRSYRFQQMLRLDYSVEECKEFDQSILDIAVPAAKQIYDKRRNTLGYNTLRPWDLNVDIQSRKPLRPYQKIDELVSRSSQIFHKVDPVLGKYFDTMQDENLLDLENRKNKAPGAYCIDFRVINRPFIFHNAVGLHDDVMTLLHEAGHAFHVFETVHLPFDQQLEYGAEIAEVASTAMELLASPYLTKDQGGFYSPAEAARARIEHLESFILFWPYMAVVDLFQHWVYENSEDAKKTEKCNATWSKLWDKYMVGIDYSGFEDVKITGWHRKLHIFQEPFYYIDYGLAQIGAIQIWKYSLKDQSGAVAKYRQGLSLGATSTLPELFKATGGKLAFDADTVSEATKLLMNTINELEKVK